MEQPWRVEHRRGTAQALHDLAVSEPLDGRTVIVQEAVAPALVLGSAQDDRMVDRLRLETAGIELARRRSGGGAVLLRPGDHVWVDLLIGSDDPLWELDVERAAWWVGEAWTAALGLGERTGVEIHRHGLSDRGAGRIACFAAVGPGEVTVDGRKALGISQRRTRLGARFQCIAYRDWQPLLLASLMRADAPIPTAVSDALLERVLAPVDPGWDVVEDLVPLLP